MDDNKKETPRQETRKQESPLERIRRWDGKIDPDGYRKHLIAKYR